MTIIKQGDEYLYTRARTANANAHASSVGGGISDERGIAAGTYYFVMTNLGSGAASGVFSARWEERP